MFLIVRGHTVYTPPLGGESVVVDLGANRGAFSRDVMARFGGRCLLVEANPALNRLLAVEGGGRVLPWAVAPTAGVVRFHIARNDEGSSLLTLPPTSRIDCVLAEEVEVPARPLADVLSEAGPRVDLVKIDIEGAEVEVLGAADEATLARVGQLTVEFHSDPVFGLVSRVAVDQVINRLEGFGFLALDFSGQTRMDVLFINRRRHPLPRLWAAWWRLRYRPPKTLHRLRLLVPEGVRRRIRGLTVRRGPA